MMVLNPGRFGFSSPGASKDREDTFLVRSCSLSRSLARTPPNYLFIQAVNYSS
jgi:hypothetical protein